jgi:uncharacterized protein YbaP (TraB family)
MIKEARIKNRFVDALATDIRYAVLTKSGRIQILVKPSSKQLRKRGQRGWHLYGTVESQSDAPQLLQDLLDAVLKEADAENTGRASKKARV